MGGLSEVTCLYDTRDKTAVEGKDYERTGGILTFDNGQKQKVISIKLLKHVFESAKTFEVILTQPTVGAKIGSINRTEVTITNNEPEDVIQFEKGQYSVKGSVGYAEVTVVRENAGLSEVTCLYDTRDKTAVEGKDYE